MSKSKSIPYYIVLICLGLIFGSMILILLWPIIDSGIISVRVMGTDVGFYAPTFLISLFLFFAFITFAIKVFRSKNSRLMAIIYSIFSGIAFIISLGYQSFGWTTYPSLDALHRSNDKILNFLILFSSVYQL